VSNGLLPNPDRVDVGLPPIAGASSAAASGAVGAAAALAAGQLLAVVLDVAPSPLLAVGGEFVDRFAAQLKELAVSLFGTNDKAALVLGTIVVSILLGALAGVGARRRRWVTVVVFGAFAAVGALAQISDPRPVGPVAWLIAAVSATAGVAVTWFLLGRATALAGAQAHAEASTAQPSSFSEAPAGTGAGAVALARRRFLGGLGGLAALSVAGAAIGRSVRRSDVAAQAARKVRLPVPRRRRSLPADQPFTVPGATPYVTSNDAFYRIDTALSAPQVDIDSWRLRIDGMVDDPLELTYPDLLALPSVEEPVTLQCVSNQVGGDLVGNAVWQGVLLTDLLEQAGVRDGAEQVFSRSVDGWTCGFPTSALGDGRVALVAYAMNGAPLPVPHGFPARLVVSGLYGYVSATKWLEQIELTTWEGNDGYWVPRGWAKEGPIKIASRIDVPRAGQAVSGPAVSLGGVAWLPATGVAAVEVSVDQGPWMRAELGLVASDDTWVTWRLAVELAPGDHSARVRAIGRDGRTQTARRAEPAPDGATGLHEVDFEVQRS